MCTLWSSILFDACGHVSSEYCAASLPHALLLWFAVEKSCNSSKWVRNHLPLPSGPLSQTSALPVFHCIFLLVYFCLCDCAPHCCILLYLPYFHIRMGSLLAWRCSSPKRPSFTQTPNHLFSMMSSSTKLPTMENLLLPAMPTPLLIQCPNRPRHPSHPNTPRNNHPVIVNPCLGGTPHLAFTLHQVATHHPADTLPLGTIPPPPATHPPTIRPPNTNACPRPPPPHLSYAGPEVDHKLPSQSVRRLEESAREDTSVHPPPHLTSPSCLPHRPGWSAARSAPGPCRHSPDPVSTQPGIHTLKCTNICHNLIYPAISALNQSLVISR